jgi:TPR repeat protein
LPYFSIVNATKQRKSRMMLKRYAMAVVLTLFSVIPSVAGDPSDFEATKKLAEQGNAGAQSSLGDMYKYGGGVPQNYEQAVKWYTKAAEQGDVYAQVSLGLMYQYGGGVPQNYEQAVKWYTKAAEQGEVYAQFNLGSMYRNGQGVPQNYKEAYIWASLAAAHSPAPEGATKVRDAVAKKLPPKDLIAAQQRAAELQKQIEANQLEANQGKTAIQPPIRLPYYP